MFRPGSLLSTLGAYVTVEPVMGVELAVGWILPLEESAVVGGTELHPHSHLHPWPIQTSKDPGMFWVSFPLRFLSSGQAACLTLHCCPAHRLPLMAYPAFLHSQDCSSSRAAGAGARGSLRPGKMQHEGGERRGMGVEIVLLK